MQLGQGPTYRPAYYGLSGHRLLDLGRASEASARFEQALARAPEDPALANAVAYAYAEAGVELERAAALVDQALEAEPDNPDFLDTLGWIQCKQGDREAAQANLARASELSGGEVDEIEEHRRACEG